MKKSIKLILIIFSILLFSCHPIKKDDLDKEFELCSNSRYKRKIDFHYKDIGATKEAMINIHTLLEQFLIKENLLKEINKEGYKQLLLRASNKEIKIEFLKKFEQELGFNPHMLFPINMHLQCYDNLFNKSKTIDNDTKEIWQYKFGLVYNKYQAYGGMELDNEYLINALDEIPDHKFQMILYRKLFLDLLYSH
ncbi:hypothetical protein [Aquimarina rhabdastrellae]